VIIVYGVDYQGI